MCHKKESEKCAMGVQIKELLPSRSQDLGLGAGFRAGLGR